MKINKKNKAFTEAGFLLISIIIFMFALTFIIIVWTIVTNEKYKTFKYSARILGYNAVTYSLTKTTDKKIYLKELLDKGYLLSLTNPFDDFRPCDKEKSYVEIKNNNYYITLKCSNYWIVNYNFYDDQKIKIYKQSKGNLKIVKELKN